MEEKIWFKDINGFLTERNFLKFFPTSNMTYIEQINSIIRFGIYFTIILLLFRNNYKVFYILVGILLITTAMYIVETKKILKRKEEYTKSKLARSRKHKKNCIKPTKNNPFMNVEISEYDTDKRMGLEACDIDNDNIKEDMINKFNDKLYRSTDDVYMNYNNDRQFYTMPVTDVVNDQTGFAKWLYDRGPTCKQGNAEACYNNVSKVIIGRV